MVYNDIKHVLGHFRFEGVYLSAEEIQSGNINNTYHLSYKTREGKTTQYVLQRINNYAFKHPEQVMSNIVRVTNHLRANCAQLGLPPERSTLTVIETDQGKNMYVDGRGSCWRAYHFIDQARAYDRVEKPEHFYEAGVAFGAFQRLLADFPADEIYETIPDFHNTRKRFYTFVASVAEDRAGRVKDLEPEIDFFFERRKRMSKIVGMIEQGILPLRVTHNDTKINNVLIDTNTDKALCPIDLDTVMPGSVLYDYGDAIRFGASTAAEDEPDTEKIHLDMELFELFTKGFVSRTKGFLTIAEMENLPLGIEVMTCELAMRFLTDYMDGDLYFKVRSPEHNLIRARAQMKLLTDIESKRGAIQQTVDQFIAREVSAAES